MKKTLVSLMAGLTVLPVLLMGCASPYSGPRETRQYNYSDFTNVQVGNAFQVEIVPSDSYSIQITAPQQLYKYIEVNKTGNTLEVGINWTGFISNLGVNNRPELKITMPELDILDLSGAARGVAKGFRSNKDFKLTLSGASTADINIESYDASLNLTGASKVNGQLKGHDIRLNLSGASTASLDGSGNNINLQASGASTANLDAFTSKDVRADLSGASHAQVLPSGKLDVFLSGASRLEYAGNPTMGTVDISGASTLTKV